VEAKQALNIGSLAMAGGELMKMRCLRNAGYDQGKAQRQHETPARGWAHQKQ